jgi:hypothetical protein
MMEHDGAGAMEDDGRPPAVRFVTSALVREIELALANTTASESEIAILFSAPASGKYLIGLYTPGDNGSVAKAETRCAMRSSTSGRHTRNTARSKGPQPKKTPRHRPGPLVSSPRPWRFLSSHHERTPKWDSSYLRRGRR